VRCELRLANEGAEPVILQFRTSQRGDVALEQDGVERWRWSDGQMFLQVLGERELVPGEMWLLELEGVLDVEPGEYEAVATVSSEPAPPPARQRVVVERT
jgi:intracellular proteinase inhibitor BsuPI